MKIILFVVVAMIHVSAWDSFEHYNNTMNHFHSLCGMFPKNDSRYENPLKEHPTLRPALDIPKEFDARKQWPQCANLIGRIRDQSNCGSCWAFGTTEAWNDRLCIHKNYKEVLSALDTSACCTSGCFGCGGGNPGNVWKWFQSAGVCSGGDPPDIGQGTGCKPYPLPICWHHEKTDKHPACDSVKYPLPSCTSSCSDSKYTTSYSSDKKRASSAYSVSGVEKIQTEIMTNGPVTGGFTVYEDFVVYKKGVYQVYPFAHVLGQHAIKIIGWGTDPRPWPCYAKDASLTDAWCTYECTAAWPINCQPSQCACDDNGPAQQPLDYWLVANSWNDLWGDKGYFKILRGHDHCEIESHISAGMP